MRTCPYCKEAIQDGAIKCPHCQSMLVPEQSPGPAAEKNEVVYVLDRGLIRFGKFAGAVLAIFIVFGVYVFGFDLNELVDRMEATKDQIRTLTEEMDDAKASMEAAQQDLENAQREITKGLAEIEVHRRELQRIKEESEALLSEAKQRVTAIKEQGRTVEVMIVGLKQGSGLEVQTVSVEQPGGMPGVNAGSSNRGKLWPVGSVIRVRFLDGDPAVQSYVERLVQEWTEQANIEFDFVDLDDAEIRISFADDGAWSYVGTDARLIPGNEPTLNLGSIVGATEEEAAATVYRHFGFVLGLLNEHQNPNIPFEWDRDAVRAELGWSETELDSALFNKWPAGAFPIDKPFDPQSVMMYPIKEEWTAGDFSTGMASVLSEKDKQFVAALYPFD